MSTPAARLARIDRMFAGWVIIAVALGVAAVVFTSRPIAVGGQTGPALTPPAPTPSPPSQEVTVTVGPLTGGVEALDSPEAVVRVLDVATLESRPSRRRLPQAAATAADRFIAATSGGQPIAGLQISIGPTGRGTLTGSLTRAQLARLCFPAFMTPPGVDVGDLIVSPGHLVRARAVGATVCVDFAFVEAGTFVVGARTKPVIPELAAFYASTGGEATWGPCLTDGFFVAVGPAGTIVEVPEGDGLYMQVCANGVLGYHAELAGSGYEVQRVLAPHWVRSEDGRFAGADPPVRNAGEGRYFAQTGHNVSGAFLTAFLALGGAEALGYPITEARPAAPGFSDQYFQYLKLRMDEATGEVTIRPVGREFVAMLAASQRAGAVAP